MYAVGRAHPLRAQARRFFEKSPGPLCTSAEVLQELLHAYLPVGRLETLDAALTLARGTTRAIWPIEADDVELARTLVDQHPSLTARDVLHLACCRRHDVVKVQTFDRALRAAFE